MHVNELFDPEFLESLSRLRILARRVARGGRHADQRSKDLGSGIEFRDFRPYSPGDDFRPTRQVNLHPVCLMRAPAIALLVMRPQLFRRSFDIPAGA